MTTTNNLPIEVTSFIGREQQMADLRRLLYRSRLVTLTGPGGAGKTRLALRLAASALQRHPDGVFLVELATVNDPRLLDQTVASVCGIREQRRRPIVELLLKTLASRKVLLVLDCCEHLVDPCADLVGRIQRTCPRVTVLVTSREPLGLPGEVIWRVPSLTVPPAIQGLRPDVILQSEAVRLFVERAKLSRPDFLLDAQTSPVVAQICARLEGIPLAIELAAGLARVLTLEDILARLRDRFRLLTGGSRSTLPRHQTLRAAVDWSYGLLNEQEATALVRLSVFIGGFELAAAEAVAADEHIESADVLPVLSRLVDKSLVVADHSDRQRTRYRMLDTIREYALEKVLAGDEEEMRRRHTRYFTEMGARASDQLRSRDQFEWLRRLDADQGNIRLAMEWCLAEQPEDALRLVAGMHRYWTMRGHLDEGLEWLTRALDTPMPDSSSKAAAYLARAHIRWMHGDYESARADALACADLCGSGGEYQLRFGALTLLGMLSSGKGDWNAAARLHEEAFQVAWQLKDTWWVATSLNNLALIAMDRGDYQVARSRIEQALADSRQTGDRISIANSLDSIGRVHIRLGDHNAAREAFIEALAIFAEVKDPASSATCLDGLAEVELKSGMPERTVTLTAAAQSIRTPVGIEPTPDWKAQVDGTLSAARSQLSPQMAESAWRQGAGFDMDQAIRYASGARVTEPRDGGSPLTGREKQVALLIAEGLTNPEIAGRLHMAERTADAHVEHIRNKLGLRTRSQIAVWAHERLGTA